MLYPKESQTRQVKDLSGIWEFKVDKKNEGRGKNWHADPLNDTIMMPVPASYNDITQDIAIRDHIGDVWYEKTFFVPASWADQRIVVRVGSTTHHAVMWVNGTEVASHKGGYMPFEADVTEIVNFGKENRVTLVVNNVLDWSTLPPGEIIKGGTKSNQSQLGEGMHAPDMTEQDYFHDFFNYAGIHRPVLVTAMPKTYVDDITVTTDIKGSDGIVGYDIKLGGPDAKVRVTLFDADGKQVASASGPKGELKVKNAKLWEPGNAYLYTLHAHAVSDSGDIIDIYPLAVGIRTIKVTEKQFLINGKPFFFKGFGKHEDMAIRGKGHDDAINIKDFNLLKWIGANSFRTSHYPYSEELMDLADREGIVIINESPAVGLKFDAPTRQFFTDERLSHGLLDHHLEVMREMVDRDKNHPSTVMWSVANEAATFEENSEPYFKKLAEYTKQLDPTRPVTIVNSSMPEKCHVQQYYDMVCFNRYYSWYTDSGHLEVIEAQHEHKLRLWHKRFKQPVMMTEYGADAIAGFHVDPPVMFSEEYQCELIRHFNNVHDKLDFFVGEQIWNFADFATKQGITRVVGNKKGVFTRDRQPKMAAHMMRDRWTKIPDFNAK